MFHIQRTFKQWFCYQARSMSSVTQRSYKFDSLRY